MSNPSERQETDTTEGDADKPLEDPSVGPSAKQEPCPSISGQSMQTALTSTLQEFNQSAIQEVKSELPPPQEKTSATPITKK